MWMTAEDWRGWAEQQRDVLVGNPPPSDEEVVLEPSAGVQIDPADVPLWGTQYAG